MRVGRRRRTSAAGRATAPRAAGSAVATRLSTRLTACARSPRRTMRVRLERVIRERLHDAGARDGLDPGSRPVAADVGDDDRRSPRARRSISPRRMPSSAASCARVTVGDASIERYSSGIASNASLLAHRIDLRGRRLRRLDRVGRGVGVGRLRPLAVAFEDFGDQQQRAGVGRIERRRPAGRATRADARSPALCSIAASSRYRKALSGDAAIARGSRGALRRACRPRPPCAPSRCSAGRRGT